MTASFLSDNGLPGSQSAIAALLQQLTAPPAPGPGAQPAASGSPAPAPPGHVTLNGITMPAPQAAPMPQVVAPPQPRSLAQRIGGLLAAPVHGLLGLGDTQAPGGYEGLLTPDEIKSAKPGRLQSLIGTPDAPSPSARYQSNLDHMIALKQLASGISDRQRIETAIATMPKLPDNATEDQFKSWAQKAYAHAVQNNLPEDIKSKFANIVTESIKQAKPEDTHVLTPGSVLLDSTGKPLYTNPAGPKAPVIGSDEWKQIEVFKAKLAADYKVDPTQIIQGADADGNSHFYRVPKNGGPPEMIDGIAPKVTIKSESAQQELTRARAQASVSEMNNADKLMTDIETRIANGTLKIGNIGQILGSMANTFTHDDPASKIIQNTALTAINKANPELARYIRRALSFAEGESGISARPSDFRTRMAAFLSQAANGATPEMIQDIGSRRRVILNTLNRIYPEAAAEGQGKGAPGAVPKAAATAGVPSYEEWLKSKGGKP